MAAQDYLDRIAAAMPRMLPERDQIVADVRAHIEERLQRGDDLDVIVARLGDPDTLVESYLTAVPMMPGSFWRRGAAKTIDIAVPFAAAVAFLWWAPGAAFVAFTILLAIFGAYVLVAESRYGQTLGKRWMGLLVVRESRTRASVGQVVVRYLPWLLQIFWIDAFFALFTDKHQRAFELLSKTRVVVIRRPAGSVAVTDHA
jgi:uncharacterized RDD family membrane protein YckC